MNNVISAAIKRYKTTLLIFFLIIFGGITSYQNMPREAEPDVPIPIISITISHYGMSPEDSEKMLIKPLEEQIRGIDNIKEITSKAFESGAHILVEFESGTDSATSFSDVREAVNQAKQDLPSDIKEPELKEMSLSDTKPILNIILSGKAPEDSLIFLAREIQEDLEALKNVSRIELTGDRDEQIEIIISPEEIKTYSLDQREILSTVQFNNSLSPVGSLNSENGKYTFKMSGNLRSIQDIYNTPIKMMGNKIVTFQDIAKIIRVHKDADSKAFFNGEQAIGMSVIKAGGANILHTMVQIDEVIQKYKNKLPKTVSISYSENEADRVNTMIDDLQNSILSSIILVLIVIIAALGLRSATLVGISIPGAFLMSMIVLSSMGVTINIIVLFALIMSVGMLVDGAIVVTEYADMKLAEGYSKFQAYMESVERMSWPIIASTITTLAAFIPLMFWPGITGELMKFLPITVVCTLTASLFMALIFVPTIGALIGKKRSLSKKAQLNVDHIQNCNFDKITGFEKYYYNVLNQAVKSPIITICFVLFITVSIFSAYKGGEPKKLFFPEVEQRGSNILIHSKSDLSIKEKEDIVMSIEKKITSNEKLMRDVESVYTKIQNNRDLIGDIRVRYVDWQKRKKGALVTDDIRELLSDISGVKIEIMEEKGGPSKGKALQLNLYADSRDELYEVITPIISELNKLDYLIELEDNRPLNGLQWEIIVDRKKAAKYDANIFAISNYIQMITHGLKVGEFRPDDLDTSIDIKIRYPERMRTLDSLSNLLIKTKRGMVPVEYFIEKRHIPKVETITRVNGRETIQIGANTISGVGINEKLDEVSKVISEAANKAGIKIDFEYKGNIEKQKETSEFLKGTILIVIVIMYLVLTLQFDKYYQGIITLSAIVFAVIGCLLLLHITNEPFGVVMGGIGIISLAGIVVNNNIVLIDSFNHKVEIEKKEHYNAVIETGIQRFRPVMLTTVTTILGLIPMAIQLNINLFAGELFWNSPASYWWAPLSMMVIGGLIFSSIITLFLTPCLLVFLKKEYLIINKIKSGINYFRKA